MSIKNAIKYALFLGMTNALLVGCGVDKGGDNGDNDLVDGFPSNKTLLFYNTTTNEHYTYNSSTGDLVNLNSNATDYEEFYLSNAVDAKYFIWIDDKDTDNATDDEEKVLMFNGNYTYADDGNATYADFRYLAHFHEEDGADVLAAHDNDEFNVTQEESPAKYAAMIRLNNYLAEQSEVESILESKLGNLTTSTSLCGIYVPIEDEEEEVHIHYHYAMGTNGKLYLFTEADNNSLTLSDSVTIADSCTTDELGMTRNGDGLLLFLASTQKVYLVDAHGDEVAHIHSSWNLSEFVGDGHDMTIMTGLGEGEHDDDE